MNLNEIFQLRKSQDFICNTRETKGPIHVRALASQLNLSVGLVSQYLVVLSKAGIVSKLGRSSRVSMDNSVTRTIKLFLNVSELDVSIVKAEGGDNLLGVGF
ncbi:ArsR family transcriptional regulator [Candidatus Bathyarchaeota archaeon]|nr:ArsR family transcriptional regulator [Candidatus Bathyarchaeota archaeon]